jgi:hypothetical protein
MNSAGIRRIGDRTQGSQPDDRGAASLLGYPLIGRADRVYADGWQISSIDSFRRDQAGEKFHGLEQPSPEGRHWVAEMGLFLGTWRGQRGGHEVLHKQYRQGYWLRWWTSDEQLLPWASERAEQGREVAHQERQRANQERDRAEQAEAALVAERERSARLAAELEQLRSR